MAKPTAQIYTQAGILGFSPNTNLGGVKIEPKLILLVSLASILFIKVLGIILRKVG
ncbi:MAG: hypothetical protein ACK4J0_00075 [Candidatus Anstonellaceae archaeon]